MCSEGGYILGKRTLTRPSRDTKDVALIRKKANASKKSIFVVVVLLSIVQFS